MSMEIDIANGRRAPLVGLKLNPDMSYEEFETLCADLGDAHKFIQFAIGDALIQGEALFGERVYQAAERFNISEKGMMEYVRVAMKVPISIRHKTLSWSHHRAIASLPYAEQREWLARARDERLSHHALRDALRSGGDTVLAPSQDPARVCECCGARL